jgi:hypothetical protein
MLQPTYPKVSKGGSEEVRTWCEEVHEMREEGEEWFTYCRDACL